MAVTRSWELRTELVQAAAKRRPLGALLWIFAAAAFVIAGLLSVFVAKTQNFADVRERLAHGDMLDLNTVSSAEQLAPFLQVFTDPAERDLAQQRLWEFVQRARPLPNVGALSRIRISRSEIDSDPRWNLLRKQAASVVARQGNTSHRPGEIHIQLVPLSKLKPLFVVRTPRDYLREFLLWTSVFVLSFVVVALVWRWRHFEGDAYLLPALLLLAGMGLILAVSLRDPLRDTLEFKKFAWGSALGCAMLLLPAFPVFDYRRFSRWIYTPLLAAFALFILLLKLGSGPGGSDAKVNLGPFQPVELVKILIVFFLAGYFSTKWERLRDLREKRFFPALFRRFDVPRFAQVLPVLVGVGGALALFFLLKDLGPALVTGFLFLAMFSVSRARAGLAVLGIGLLVGGITLGYKFGTPATVVDRISMWLSPWDNNVHGGNQLAHSLWALSTGGLRGSGPGWGDPAMIPAGHTDLVLSSLGEEWGFIGVATVFLLFAFLIRRSFRIALNSPNEYGLFLGIGLSSLLALEMLLISGGVLGAIPLSGVVSPFLSSGNTAMLANFLIFALILSISNRPQDYPNVSRPFRRPAYTVLALLGACAAALLFVDARYQISDDQQLMSRDTKVFEDDGVKRAQHNPRLNSLAHELVRGNIYDRNGVLLATSDWNELERRRDQYSKLGVNIDQCCSRIDARHYPFGASTEHLLGDLRTQENFHASNASPLEHDSNARLQGFGDIRELASYIRYRHRPDNRAVADLKARDRSVHTTIDIRLQLRAEQILAQHLQKAGKDKGALVVIDPHSGDVLALVSFPASSSSHADNDTMLDRARYGQYPPGSTFKLVTAMAALEKDPKLANRSFACRRLGDGRSGTVIPGWRRVIHDDVGDSAHGTLTMARAIQVSCNAYFAQLGVYDVGAENLAHAAQSLDLPVGSIADLKATLPFAAYGQGPVLVTPFKMARIAATIANGGAMAQGRWNTDPSNTRTQPPRTIVDQNDADFLARSMRLVITGGTARRPFIGSKVSVAGKTGTAQLDDGLPHSWFTGFAPFDGDRSHSIAFAVVVEHGGYGATVAAPVARELVDAAQELGILAHSGDAPKHP